ncbi:Uncharacterised protein [Tsukamurella pulmonis]|nr:Uncharacterised protein [Tsukamurella pulmonis]
MGDRRGQSPGQGLTAAARRTCSGGASPNGLGEARGARMRTGDLPEERGSVTDYEPVVQVPASTWAGVQVVAGLVAPCVFVRVAACGVAVAAGVVVVG